MAKDEIVEKLKRFLEVHTPLMEECHVVYLMVQIRKILDHERQVGGLAFPLLRFYCDWTVHTEKERITPSMKTIMEDIFASVRFQITNGPFAKRNQNSVTQFAYMAQLRVEAQQFAARHDLGSSWTDEGWLHFVQLLVKVLANQPIVKPIDDIEIFSFLPAADECVGCLVKFTNHISGHDGNQYDHYTYYNAY